MTTDRQWDRAAFENIEIPQMETTMNKDCKEDKDIGKAIIDHYFTKTRLTQKQSGHRLWINSKAVQQPPNLEQAGEQQEEQSTHQPNTIQPPPGLEQPAAYIYIYPTPKAMAIQDNYKPPLWHHTG
eukprot:260191-Amphidinium_carterae.4